MLVILFRDSVATGFISLLNFSLAVLQFLIFEEGIMSLLKDFCIKIGAEQLSYVES